MTKINDETKPYPRYYRRGSGTKRRESEDATSADQYLVLVEGDIPVCRSLGFQRPPVPSRLYLDEQELVSDGYYYVPGVHELS